MKQYLGIALLLVLMSCNNADHKSSGAKDSIVNKQVEAKVTSLGFKDDKVAQIYADYILLKDALVATKFDDAKVAAKTLALSLKGYAGCESTAVTAGKIENAKDIVAQRTLFTSLNSDVIALFKHADLDKGTIYVQHCPMANNGDGGDWLSSEKNIRNPYYGSEMMECGAVLTEIKAK